MTANPSTSPISASPRVSRVSGRVASTDAPQGPFRRNAGGGNGAPLQPPLSAPTVGDVRTPNPYTTAA